MGRRVSRTPVRLYRRPQDVGYTGPTVSALMETWPPEGMLSSTTLICPYGQGLHSMVGEVSGITVLPSSRERLVRQSYRNKAEWAEGSCELEEGTA